MKAILLSAGYGKRLGELTKNIPKCLLSVANKSMLEHWFYLFRLYNIKDILINTHYFPEKVFSEACNLSKIYNLNVFFSYEKELLGTAKTIFDNRSFIGEDRSFIVAFVDTWLQVDIKSMYKFQRRHRGIGTVLIYTPKDMKDQGCFVIEKRKILSIEEKPKNPTSKYSFAGVMIADKSILRFYKEGMTDLVGHWLPEVKNGLNPFFYSGNIFDIGTPERYKEANEVISGLGLKAL